GPHPGLFADDAVAVHLAHLAVVVGDDPVARDQARADGAVGDDRNGVGECIAVVPRCRLVVEEPGIDRDGDVVGLLAAHGGGFSGTRAAAASATNAAGASCSARARGSTPAEAISVASSSPCRAFASVLRRCP